VSRVLFADFFLAAIVFEWALYLFTSKLIKLLIMGGAKVNYRTMYRVQ
jgi:hypothetical protein